MRICPHLLLGAFLLFTACATTQNQPLNNSNPEFMTPQRPLPYPIDYPADFERAVMNGTRTLTGEPGPNYFTQWSEYVIDAELIPEDTMVVATAQITYHNNSPFSLPGLVLELAQNVHAEGSIRKEPVEITAGTKIHSVQLRNSNIDYDNRLRAGVEGYAVDGTNMFISTGEAVQPGSSIDMEIRFSFKVPQRGASARMGYNADNLFHIAYWFPHVAVFDDLQGFFTDPFTANAEFYHGFGDYEVNFTAPEQWVVMGTGALLNPEEVLAPEIYQRYLKAIGSDDPVVIAESTDFGNLTGNTESGKITWKFKADKVRDVAYSFMRESNWDAARTPVGDLNNDGETDYTTIHSFWRDSAPLWEEEVKYAQHSVAFLSEYTGLSYPWPHMTSVEAGGIIGGGMEFPMITIMGSYNGRGPQSLYDVTVHEIAHMWIPMIVSNNERRHAWMDEGSTTFHEAKARWDFNPDTFDRLDEFSRYLSIAGTAAEGEIIRWSDYHYPGPAYGIASYPKPGSVLIALEGVLGTETFTEAWKAFIDRWAYKHPTPYDLFNTFEDISGEELDWFWRSWYFETWVLDQAIADVVQSEDDVTITVEDLGRIPMPVDLTLTFENGSTMESRIQVEEWLKGKTSASITIPTENYSPLVSVEIDSAHYFPDKNRSNNTWEP